MAKSVKRPQPKERARRTLKSALWHVSRAGLLLDELVPEGGAEEMLDIAIKALRTITNTTGIDQRAVGLARGALKRMGVPSDTLNSRHGCGHTPVLAVLQTACCHGTEGCRGMGEKHWC